MMKRLRPLLLLAVVLALIASACGGDDDDSAGSSAPSGNSVPDGPEIKIGAQDFGESSILAQIYGQALDAKGYKVKYQALGGFRDIVYKSFDNGDINLTPEYAASALEFLNNNAGEATPDADETVTKLREQLKKKDLTALDPSPAVDSNAFVVTKETADKEGLSSISDLADKTSTLTLGGPPDCPTNPFCIPGLKDRYGIDFSKSFKALDAAGPITVQALKSDEVQVAILFSTNAQIAVNKWVVLKDDKGLINADNVVPVLTNELVSKYGTDMSDLLNQVSAALTTGELTELNRKYEIDKEDPEQIAKDFLQSKNLL
jgi:osmoprotectant transport system substrate-binding protein